MGKKALIEYRITQNLPQIHADVSQIRADKVMIHKSMRATISEICAVLNLRKSAGNKKTQRGLHEIPITKI